MVRIHCRYHRTRPGGQHFDQASFAKLIFDVIPRQLDQPTASQRAGDIALGVVDRYPVGEFELARLAFDHQLKRIGPVMTTGEESHGLVCGQFVGVVRLSDSSASR